MTILSALHSSRIRNRSMGVLHLIAADERCEVSDILALITPSQPEAPSKPHAPAADTTATQAAGDTTDGEVVPPPSTSPSVEPIHQWSVAPGSVIPAPFYLDTDTIPEAPKPLPDDQEMHRPAEAKTSDQAGGGAVSAVKGSARLENADGVEPPPSEPIKKPTRRATLRTLVAEHPDWTAKELAFAMGIGEDNVRSIASQIGLRLPKASTKAERAKAATTEALKGAPAKPQEPVERAGPPTPRPEPKQPPVSTAAEPFDDDEPAPRVRKVTKAPTGRFYLRDKDGRFVHQSLQKSPTAPGPLMTSDRKWAWYDTMERYRGAKKKWPELAEMRKEAVQP